jgi:hypothetical protein
MIMMMLLRWMVTCVFMLILQWRTMVNRVTCIPTVVIINNALPRDSLHVNCHSKDDDLGWHIVSYNSIYIITFEDNLFWDHDVCM